MSTRLQMALALTESLTVSGNLTIKTSRIYIKGFTLIELLIVMAVIAVLLTLVTPNFFNSVDKSKEAALQHDLSVVRDSIDKFYGDTGKYPDSLQELVNKRYLKNIPIDPITESNATWLIVNNPDPSSGKVIDIKSGSTKLSSKGTPYSSW